MGHFVFLCRPAFFSIAVYCLSLSCPFLPIFVPLSLPFSLFLAPRSDKPFFSLSLPRMRTTTRELKRRPVASALGINRGNAASDLSSCVYCAALEALEAEWINYLVIG